MTELDLMALGIWRIPIPLPARGVVVNAWAIEDANGGIALFDCGLDSPESLAALADGLAEANASLDDVRRLILSHGHPEHAGGARHVLGRPARPVPVFVSGAEPLTLPGAGGHVHPLRDGDRLQFKRFVATALHTPGHTAGLSCLFAEEQGILFSSDHLLHGVEPIATCDLANDDLDAVQAYRKSLLRLGALDVRVVLPGRGAPFAGHRRVVREVLSVLEVRGHHADRPTTSQQESGRSLHDAA